MRKQFIALLLGAAVMMEGSILMATEQQTQASTQENTVQAVKTKGIYMTKVGQVTEIINEQDANRVLVGTPADGIYFVLNSKEMIIDAETLSYLKPEQIKEGMTVTVVFPKDAPMTLSLPACSGSQVAIIVHSPDTFIEQGYFNESLVNEENTLALNIDQTTTIMNTTGERRIFTEEDVKNQNAVVIYSTSTRSIPAQTTPKMVLVLSNEGASQEQEIVEINQEERAINAEEETYRSVRELAETYGYRIEWDHSSKTVTLVKNERVLSLVVGKTEYTDDQKIGQLSGKVKMVGQKVYVPEELSKHL